jgi:predicted ATPase
MELFYFYKFESTLNVSPETMSGFLKKVEKTYLKTNSYHNSTHAADVLHAMHYFINTMGLAQQLTHEDVFASLIAAIIHDVEHPGFNNLFLIATMSPIALRYNDISVFYFN